MQSPPYFLFLEFIPPFTLPWTQVGTPTPPHSCSSFRTEGKQPHQPGCPLFLWRYIDYAPRTLEETRQLLWYPSLLPLVSTPLPFPTASPLISRIEPPVRSLRHRRLCTRHHTNDTHQIATPRDRCTKYSWNGQQGRGGILCSHSLVSFLGCGYVRCGEGKILRASTRAKSLLTAESAFPASGCGGRDDVSRPEARSRGSEPHHSLLTIFSFPLAEEILCEIPSAPATGNTRLIDMDPIRFIPMMVTRTIISLKKVATERRSNLCLEVPTAPPISAQYCCSSNPVAGIPLSALNGERA